MPAVLNDDVNERGQDAASDEQTRDSPFVHVITFGRESHRVRAEALCWTTTMTIGTSILLAVAHSVHA